VTLIVPTSPRWRLGAGDVVVLRGNAEYTEGEVIAVLAGGGYRVTWTIGLGYRDRITTVPPPFRPSTQGLGTRRRRLNSRVAYDRNNVARTTAGILISD